MLYSYKHSSYANDRILHSPLLLNKQTEQNFKKVNTILSVKFHHTTFICEYNLEVKGKAH